MKKRNYEIILSIMLLLMLTSSSAMANPAVGLGTVSGAVCEQVIVPITLTNDGLISVAGIGVDIGYNSQYLTPISAVIGPAGQLAGKTISTNIVSAGLYRVLIFSISNTSAIGNGIIGYVTFEISCSAPETTYTLGNTPSSSTADGSPVATDGSNGAIQVGAANTSTTTSLRPPEEHIVSCNVCHLATVHNYPTHTNDCTVCHIPGDVNTPQPNQCIVCHPLGNTGTCNLVNFHDPGKSAPCLTCHVDCNGTTTDDHIKQCVLCHPTSFGSTDTLRVHSRPGHTDCTICHVGTPGLGNVTADKCAGCHPLGDTGQCKLVDLHSPNIISSCLTCHMNCAGGAPTSTTTTSIGPTTTTTGGGTTTSTPPTTTVPQEHFDYCTTCHLKNDLHAQVSHNVCSTCHNGTPGLGNVTASNCIVCHPIGNPGQCNLVVLHGPTCSACHTDTMCPPPTTTTTTTAPTSDHYSICNTCHSSNDLHAAASHNVCSDCHNGTPGPGNVTASNCIVCHPAGAPGKCNLVVFHGQTCTSCHGDAQCPSPTTTTTVTEGTHGDICLPCHYTKDLHARPEHTECSSCHDGVPAMGNVSSDTCTACHAPKCTLVNSHGNTCTSCHVACIPVTTTTTTVSNVTTTTDTTSTTTVLPGTCEIIRVNPINGVTIGFGLIPRIAKITVTTNTDLISFGIIDSDFKFENDPRGIFVLRAKVIGSSVQAWVLFVAVQPGEYTILLGECGSTTIALHRFWRDL